MHRMPTSTPDDARTAALVARFSPAFEAAPMGVLLLDLHDETIAWANLAMRRHGVDAGDSFDRLVAFVTSPTPGGTRQTLEALAHESQPITRIRPVRMGDDERWFRVVYWPAVEDAAEPTRFVVAQTFAVRGPDRVGDVYAWLDTWPQPALVIDRREHRVVYTNIAARGTIGLALEDLPPREITAVIEASERDAVIEWYRAIGEGRDPGPVMVHHRRGDGTTRPVLLAAVSMPAGALDDHLIVIAHHIASTDAEWPSNAPREPDLPDTLTPRETEIVRLLLQGMRVANIAETLFLSRHTVRNHLRAIFTKLGVRSQTDLVAKLRATPPAGG